MRSVFFLGRSISIFPGGFFKEFGVSSGGALFSRGFFVRGPIF